MKIVAIHQPQYLPYLGFFHKLFHCDVFVVLDSVQFQKNGLQNRNKIKTSQGWQWLTVPVLHRFGQRIGEVQVEPDTRWQRKHWNALVSNYSRAPYFDRYSPKLRELLEGQWKSLCELDGALMRWAMEALGIETPILYSSTLGVAGNRTELLVNICKAVEADGYLSGPGGSRYMDLSAFEAARLTVVWQQFTSPVYTQVFPHVEFIPNLSIVDTVFCWGPETTTFLQSTDEGPGVATEAYPASGLCDMQIEATGLEEDL